ncbi:MFS transporter [Methylocystis sp. WRRC1]|uniref:MFS transporter n=1 Tax=Methylocystis sp. WRRC1 TaxID=1732014 RepID=UPI001D14D0D2|nr:MFS transporter [Methylocystis sp. WRRC1]MCC3246109.1 MFS transporter [Methylocystis sp. WRRC1]
MAKVKDDAERRLSMLAAAISAIGGVQVAFFPIWFGARGLGGGEIATLLAAAPAARIVSNLAGTHFGDRRGDYGRLILLHLLGVALIFIAMDFAYGFLALFAGHTALCFVQGPIGPLNDGLVLDEARRRREAGLPALRLARVRAWAAGAVLVFMLGAGPVARAMPDDALILIMAAISVFSLVTSFFLLRGFEAGRPREPARPIDDPTPLRRPGLLALIIACAALVHGSHGFITVFGSLQWAAKGFDATFISTAWSAAAFSEVAFFLSATRWFGGERHAAPLMAAGAAGAVLRWALLASDPGPAGIIAALLMQPFSGAALTLGPAYLIAELGGKAYTARVHGWLAAANGVTLSASLYFSGPLNAAFGVQGYLAMAAMAGAGLLLSLLVAAAVRNGVLKDERRTTPVARPALVNERDPAA